MGYHKCNTDTFCIRDHNGNLCYAQTGQIGQLTNIQAEARAILEVVRYWEREKHVLKILETDSLAMVRIISKNWKTPWEVAEMVEEI